MRTEEEVHEQSLFVQRALRELRQDGDWNYGYAEALLWVLNLGKKVES